MNNYNHPSITISAYNPYEYNDLTFAHHVHSAGGYPLIRIDGSEKEQENRLSKICNAINFKIGIISATQDLIPYPLHELVELLVLPFNADIPLDRNKKYVFIVSSAEEGIEAQKKGAYAICAKGNEAAGQVKNDSTFILFQKLKKQINIPIWIMGGLGLHSSAAFIALGAKGLIFDYQLSLFPELGISSELRSYLANMEGSETKVIHSHRIWSKPGTPKLDSTAPLDEFLKWYEEQNKSNATLELAQNIGLANYYYKKYKNLPNFLLAVREAITSHIKQAKHFFPIKPGNSLSQELSIRYPVAQGPMTRISDSPDFALTIAKEGGLPFIALSMLKGEKAKKLLLQTKELLKEKTWGVGMLGFIAPELLKEQLNYIKEIKPPVVLIAGGRPSLSKPLEEIGIKTFIHAPSTGLLDSFLKEGVKRFVFEGRECGGHVGPLHSLILWEKQITRLLEEKDLKNISVFFAGGIHDSLSSAMLSALTAPLTARGAKVGVMMGTSYLFTKEIVETGAVVERFQQENLKGTETVLLESSPGHVTCCLKSPFVDFFSNKKKELAQSVTNSKELGLYLENLNVGRLRIAAKGIERVENKLITKNAEEQHENGLYMTGQVATLRDEVISLKELHQQVSDEPSKLIEEVKIPSFKKDTAQAIDVAIIGMACILPGASNLDEYWKNILQSADCITEVPEDRWNKELFYGARSPRNTTSTSKWGGFIPDISFDPMEFGIPPRSVPSIEPAQLLSLIVTKEALRHAGYDNKEFDRENTSVIFGLESGSELALGYELRACFPSYFGAIPKELDEVLPELTEDSFPGILGNIVTGRISNRLNFGGKNFTVDAACASSLAALDVACQELVTKRANVAIAGAVDLHNSLSDYLKFSSVQALTSEGKCKSFSDDADGISLGEGVAVVILKRLEDAVRDNDTIYSVIKSVGVSSDGKSLGITAPNKKGQIKAFERAYRQAGISPSEVGLFEAHGTGTLVGDETELSSMTELMAHSGALPKQSLLGSVKTQIGHTKCAAGLAALIKTSLSLHNGILPPTLNITRPSKYYNENLSPFFFNDAPTPWLKTKRIAGVSAFGFGGTNFHTVIESHQQNPTSTTVLKQWPAELFVFRANNQEELNALLLKIKTLIEINGSIYLRDISYTLARLSSAPIKLSIVAISRKDLLEKIEQVFNHTNSKDIYYTTPVEGKIAFLFSGQGSQRINMGRDLFVAFPEMRQLLNEHPEYEQILFPKRTFDKETLEEQNSRITNTLNAQPLLGIVDYAIARLLTSFGIEPDMLAGHSYGEIPALCISGAINKEDLVEISKARAESILEAVKEDAGTMLAVNCKEDELKNILEGEKGVWMVNHNSALQWVLAGNTSDIKRVNNKLKELNKSVKLLNVACAFHSPVISEAQNIFEKKLKDYPFNDLQIPVWSNTTADKYPNTPEQVKERLCEHVVKPVRFYEEIRKMQQDGAQIFIETGPGKVLSKLTENILGKDAVSIYTESAHSNGLIQLVNTLAQYIACGKEINFKALFDGRDAQMLTLDDLDAYKPSKTVWNINGARAIPAYGELPKHAAKPIDQPIRLQSNGHNPGSTDDTNQVMLNYFNNVQTAINAQYDILLKYLGHENPQNGRNTRINLQTNKPETNNPAVARHPAEQEKSESTSTYSPEEIKKFLLETVSEKTGYPIDMIDLDMDLEADLSIDSIKRVEILGVLNNKWGGFASGNSNGEEIVEKLAAMKSLNELMGWITSQVNVLSPTNGKIQEKTSQNISPESVTQILLDVVSEKTGYPTDMIELDMDLEADLSIDSIKRVEILSVLKDKCGGFASENGNAEETVEKLAAMKSLNELVSWITSQVNVLSPTNGNGKIQEKTGQSISPESVTQILLDVVSEKTGYPADMIELDMDLEADLSIDSIKRVEILSVLKDKCGGFSSEDGNEEEIVEKLAAMKSLNELVGWITGQVNVPSPTNGNGTVQEKTGQSISPESVTQILLDVVSEKTGYPTDMIDLEMDLEADLSIDSIKRVEILSVLKDKCGGFTSENGNDEEIVEKLAAMKTLGSLAEWIQGNFAETANDTPKTTSIKTWETTEKDPEEILRFEFDFMPSLPIMESKSGLKGKRIAITNDGGYISKALKAHLEYHYAIADIIDGHNSLDGYDGLIALDFLEADEKYSIHQFFTQVQKLDYKKVNWIFACTDIRKQINDSKDKSIDRLQGYYGFLNSLNKEWEATCRTINLEDNGSVQQAASIIVDELCCYDDSPEVFYRNSKRFTAELKKVHWEENRQTEKTLKKEDVLLVLGGAQGITAEILKELALEMPCHYILVGRSPEPVEEADQIDSLDIPTIRRELLTKEKFKTPAELERRVQHIYKRNQIKQTRATLEERGVTVHYRTADVTNENDFENLIKSVYKEFGRIDGVIHAAGYLDDKYFHKKTEESFKKVFNTKVTPLKVLTKNLRKNTRFCIFFSSIASIMGNKGQVDYAAANGVLDQAAWILNDTINGRVISINWGPWKGKGMISAALEKDLLKRGISSIPILSGARAFVKEIKFGETPQVILTTNIESLTEA